MANGVGFNPYALAQSRQSIINSLISSGQLKKTSEQETVSHMGTLSKKFEREMADLRARAEAELRKPPPGIGKRSKRKNRRKYRDLAKFASFATMFIPGAGPLISASLGGIGGGMEAYIGGTKARDLSIADRNFAIQQAQEAKNIMGSLDPRWSRLFTSGRAEQFKSSGKSWAEDILSEARARTIGKKSDISEGALSKGLTDAFTSYVSAKGVKEGQEAAKAVPSGGTKISGGTSGLFGMPDPSVTTKIGKGKFGAFFEGAGKEMFSLDKNKLKESAEGLAFLQMLLEQWGLSE